MRSNPVATMSCQVRYSGLPWCRKLKSLSIICQCIGGTFDSNFSGSNNMTGRVLCALKPATCNPCCPDSRAEAAGISAAEPFAWATLAASRYRAAQSSCPLVVTKLSATLEPADMFALTAKSGSVGGEAMIHQNPQCALVQ